MFYAIILKKKQFPLANFVVPKWWCLGHFLDWPGNNGPNFVISVISLSSSGHAVTQTGRQTDRPSMKSNCYKVEPNVEKYYVVIVGAYTCAIVLYYAYKMGKKETRLTSFRVFLKTNSDKRAFKIIWI